MNNFKTLLLMQLKDKIDMAYLKNKKSAIFKIVLSIIKFVVITAIIYLAFYMIDKLRFVSLLSGIPQNFFGFVFSLMYILSIFVCTAGLTKTLFFSKDNALLLTFPAERTTVFISKVVVYYIYELIRNITYLLPLFVAYGLINSLPFYFYIWMFLPYIFVVALPVVLGSLLSIPLMYIVSFINKFKWLEIGLLLLFSGAVIAGILFLISVLPENINIVSSWGTTFWEIQDFLDLMSSSLYPFYMVMFAMVGKRTGLTNQLFSGQTFLSMAIIIGVILVCLALSYLLVRPFYFMIVSSSYEYKRKTNLKPHKINAQKPFVSHLKKEFISTMRSSSKLYNLLLVLVGMPILMLLLNKLYSAMDVRSTGRYMIIAFNVLMIALISMSSSVPYAHIYSEEGASNYLHRVSPSPYIKGLFAKLVLPMIVNFVAIVTSVIIFRSYVYLAIPQVIVLVVLLYTVYLSHLLWSAEMDIMNPQYRQYQTTGEHSNNPNDIRSLIYCMLLSALFALLTYFFVSESLNNAFYKICVFAIMFFALRLWLYINKIKVYFREML